MQHGVVLADRYEVLERLGHGGMGEVWAARDRTLRRQVALKLLPVGSGTEGGDLQARFEREAVAAAQINHPNVAALHDRGVHEGMLFLVMELVDGMSLSALINASGVLAPSRALGIAEQICAALEATHRAGVVHFDIKPQNVMITGAGTAKVVDFGIAGLVQAQQLSVIHSSRLAPAATLEYAAPEQFTEERGDARSDLYALGGVLFAMLTGHAPFTGTSAWAVMAAKVNDEAPRLEQARPGLPPELADLVAHLLKRDPAQRPQSAREARELLARAHTGLAGDEPPVGTTTFDERLPKLPTAARAATPTSVPAAGSADAASRPPAVSGPRQLPPDTRLFTGRDSELQAVFELVEQARGDAEYGSGAVVLAAIDGMGGVGKTALAIRAAHRLAAQYPDGQLFLDLYGYTDGATPRDPGDALAALLGGLGVPPQRIPAELDARAAFYRDLLAGTRTLIVLDNAADEAQIAPLLPASDTCLVLVTSRKRLKALDDALPLSLNVLAKQEAVTLLRKAARLGVNAEDEPLLEQAVELCGYLPLALLIAGALLRTGGAAWNLSVLIERLKAGRPGRELSGYTDESRSVQAIFDLSYQQLSEELKVLFRRVGLLPGPEIDAYAAAALLDSDPHAAGWLVERLADHSLLTGSAPGRFHPHDLVRAHARSLAAASDPEEDRATALDRLYVYYAHTAETASADIARHPRAANERPAPAHAPELADQVIARAWLRTEYADLDAAFTHAHAQGLDEHTIALASGLAEVLLADGPFTRALEIHQAAAETAERLGLDAARVAALNDLGRAQIATDAFPAALGVLTGSVDLARGLGLRRDEGNALTHIGRVKMLTGEYAEADDVLTRALEIFREDASPLGEANALTDLGFVLYALGRFTEAADAADRALERYRSVGHRLGEASALGVLGRIRITLGDYRGCADAQTQALQIFRELGHRLGEANALNELGRVHYLLGDYPESLDVLNQALEIYRAHRNPVGEATVLGELGRVQRLTGDYPGAVEAHARALQIFRTLGHRPGEAGALTTLGRVYYLMERYSEAEDVLSQALQIFRAIGERGNEAWALNYYAATLAATDRRARAFELYQQALAMNREFDKPDDEAISLEGIADHNLAEGAADEGVTHLREALEIYDRLGMRADSERVHARLTELDA